MSRLLASLLVLVLMPAAANARPQCKLKQDECRDAKERCTAIDSRVLDCPPGKERRCARLAARACAKQIRKCCKRTPLDTCCGGGAFVTTTTVGGGSSTTSTTGTTTFPTTTTTLGGAACTGSAQCAGFACCNVAQGKCCVLGSGDSACSGTGSGSILAGSGGCTSFDGVDFPATPEICGPSRPATCPTAAVAPISFQCHACGDGGKVMQTLYNTETGVRTPYQ